MSFLLFKSFQQMDSTDVRRYIQRQFTLRGHSLNTAALSYLTEQLKDMEKEQRQKTLARVMELVEKENVSSGLLSLDILKEILKVLSRQKKNESEIVFKLENAFDWRKELFADQLRESIECRMSPWNQLSFHAYSQRFELVKKLLCENPDKFASIDSLLTHRGQKARILALLCRGDGADFTAEDNTGKVRLDLASAQYEPGLYFEGGIFVFEGLCSTTGDCLQVEKVALPDKRYAKMGGKERQELARRKDPNDRIVFFSDVLLDNDKVMRSLYHILEGFSNNPPNIFVFCGRFLSVQRALGYTEQSTMAFRHLANIITQFALNYQNTQFILVPSIEDPPPIITFPCPPLPPNVQKCFKDVRNVHFATNPCRLIFKDQHILIWRDDMVEKLCRSAIHMPKNARAETIPKLFCDTIWSQRHLSPLPLYYSPVQPHFDALLQLWPAPDVLLLADKFKAFMEVDNEQQRLTINPGPFSGGKFEFQVYFPTLRRVDHSVYTPDE